MSAEDRVRWDARHAAIDPDGPTAPGPPAVFRDFVDRFPTSGRALELACGRGSMAVWLAGRGLDVLGADVSSVAIDDATRLAAATGTARRCRFVVADLDDGLPPGPPVDVVSCQRFRDARLDGAIVDRLAPGGLLALTALSEVDARPGPFRAARGELPRAFGALDLITAGEAAGLAWLLARRRARVVPGGGGRSPLP